MTKQEEIKILKINSDYCDCVEPKYDTASNSRKPFCTECEKNINIKQKLFYNGKFMWRALLQNFSLWILKKTKYQFQIDHDRFEIQVQPIGLGEKPTSYYFVCNHKDIGFMNYIDMTRNFYVEEMVDCPNPKVKEVRFNDEYQVKNLEKQYNNLIKAVIKSSRVVI